MQSAKADQEPLKRSRDPDGAGEEAIKRAKLETEALETAMTSGNDDITLPSAPAAGPGEDLPVTIMYKTFKTATDCRNYYSRLLAHLRQDQDLNEYEHNMVLGLLRRGHPDPPRKIGAGVSAIQIRVTPHEQQNKAFHIVRTDGSIDDFSTRKCIAKLFPKAAALAEASKGSNYDGNRGGGRGRGPRGMGGGDRSGGGRAGGGRGGGGRGGRGLGRGRGPGRGGPGRGGPGRGGPNRGRGGGRGGGRRGRF